MIVWTAFDSLKRSQLEFHEQDYEAAKEKVTAKTYLQLLQLQLFILCNTEGIIATNIFMYDNASIHSAGYIQE